MLGDALLHKVTLDLIRVVRAQLRHLLLEKYNMTPNKWPSGNTCFLVAKDHGQTDELVAVKYIKRGEKVIHMVDRVGIWHKLPVIIGIAYLGIRRHLHQRYNLFHVGKMTGKESDVKEIWYRTADGKCNHQQDDLIGSQGTFFGRNMPPSTSAYGVLDPHPSLVASKLLERKKFKDNGKQFNMIACSWIQFMIHDWVDHLEDTNQMEIIGVGEEENIASNGCPLKSFKFFKTKKVPTFTPQINFGCLNTRTPWWDGSVVYGNNNEGMTRVRSFKDGKLKISKDMLLEHDEKGIPISGDIRNCWAGFSLLQALFVKEHNVVCDMLKPSLLKYGLLGKRIKDMFGHICGPLLSGLVGLKKPRDHGIPYSLTEEFVSVYRMHSLLPEKFILRDIKSTPSKLKCPPIIEEIPMEEMIGKEGEKRLSKIGLEQMLVSLGHQACGELSLWNYPTWMRNLIAHDINGEDRPQPIDMAALEIYRDRERGVARYNEFRRNLLMVPITKWEDLTCDEEAIEALNEVYGDDVEKLDLLVGLHAEKKIKGFAIIAAKQPRPKMGIKDLLRFMKPYIEPIHIKKYAGKRVGIDAYSWLHKGAYSCSMELCLNSDGEKKLKYIDYFMHRINLLRHHKITPVVVFDGGNVPCKSTTEQDRHRRRISNREIAMAKLKEGNVSAATEFFQKAISVTPQMAHQLIQILRSENIEFVVAPYEADAQLAYLSNLEPEQGGISAVITEDSDLIAYGCETILFKMDRYGNGEEILLDNVFNSKKGRTPSFQNFDKELLTGMCVLAGCDFLPSVPGIGIAKSYAIVSKYRNLDRVLSVLKLEKGSQMPEDYPKSFREAVAVFQHAQIYDVDMKMLKHMKPLPEKLLQSLDGELDFLGPELPPSIATAIAEGKMDPISMEAFDRIPSSKSHTAPIRIQTSGQPPRVEAPMVSARESCFVTFSKKAKQVDNTGNHFYLKLYQHACILTFFCLFILTENHNKVLNERNCTNKIEALQKLVVPSSTIQETLVTTSTTMEITKSPLKLKVPNNNPFKRKILDQTQAHSNQRKYQNSDSTHVEDVEGSTMISCDDKLSLSEACRKRKLEETTPCCVIISEEISGVTQVENSEVFESQESVKLKINNNSGMKNKMSVGKKKGGAIKTLKNSSSNSLDSKKSSILNFFSRV
ncbi:hypothetical protein F8388_025284 [Cannabis sativa]|uniref:Exonuclease 1 n=1 Tax=Cannabis sativa TaxID=3483 RepID=A0A7J6FV27_CANSA|nr:hypothetical protein F8388_025284 [Cannabis sativa]